MVNDIKIFVSCNTCN